MNERYSGSEHGCERKIGDSLDRLKERYEFDLGAVLEAGEREFSAAEVQGRALDIANELNFDDEFFADDARAVTLMAVAESSVAADGLPEEKQADERKMLLDVLLAMGAEHSPVVREMAANDATLRERYFDDGEKTEIDKKQMEFLNSHVDEELSAAVLEVMKGDFLADVREELGVTAETEQPYDVKVVSMADSPYMLGKLGVFGEEVDYPPITADRNDPEVARQAQRAMEWHNAVKEAMGSYKAANDEYKEKFEPEFGPFLAFLENDTNTIYMSMEHAYAIANEATLGDFERVKAKAEDRDDVMREAAVIKHEYVHSQKIMTRGAHSQLGLAMEERRAELLSGDKQGYQAEKNFFLDLTYVTNFNMMRRLSEAAKSDDTYAAFMTAVSGVLGMRVPLLMMTATPPNYEKDKKMSKNFVDLNYLKQEGDETTYDAIVGEGVRRFGDGGFGDMMDNYVKNGGVEKLKTMYGMRKLVGFGRYRTEAMKKRIDEVDTG